MFCQQVNICSSLSRFCVLFNYCEFIFIYFGHFISYTTFWYFVWINAVSNDDCVQRTTKISTPREIKYQYLDEYGILAQGSLAITFQVKACNDAYLVVRTPETVSIQIILGGWDNTRSCIRILGTSGCLSTSIGGGFKLWSVSLIHRRLER